MAEPLRTAGGAALRLGPALAGGGEGRVHAVPDHPGLCAKIYHAAARSPERRQKLEAMLRAVPRQPTATLGHRSLAWPEEIVWEAAGPRCAGFLMPLLPAGAATALQYLQPEDRIRLHPGFDFRYLLTAARNAAAAFAAVHAAGCCVGDVNESNIMITDTALVTLIDCDSFQVPGPGGTVLRCPVGKPEYTAPELVGRPLASADRTPQSDAFGLAVLTFQLLMQGYHPFAGRWRAAAEPPGVARRIQQGLYAYGGAGPIGPPPGAPDPRVLPREVAGALQRAFGPGIADPQSRPSAAQWVDLLDEAAAHLQTCRLRPEHAYPQGLRACPWCAAERRGQDFFPAVVGAQVPLPPAAAGAVAGPASAGRARLAIEPAELTVSAVVRGGPGRTANLTVRNIGRGWFRGPVAVLPAGTELSVSPAELALSPFHGENEAHLALRIDAAAVDWGRRYVRTVRVGEASARVVVTTADDAAAARAARRSAMAAVWAAAVLAAGAAAVLAWAGGGTAWEAGVLRRVWDGAFAPGAPLRLGGLAVWLAATAACVLGSRVWRLHGHAAAWRALLRDGRFSIRAAAGAAALAAWLPLALRLDGGAALHPTPAAAGWALGILVVPGAWLAGRALVLGGMGVIRETVRRRGAGPLTALAICGCVGLAALVLTTAALAGVAAAGARGAAVPPVGLRGHGPGPG